jgi:hypothetical protein
MHNESRTAAMRKLIYSIGAIVLAAAAVFVWSRTALVPIEASTASSITLNQTLAGLSSEMTATISPTDMMINHKGPLPISTYPYECVSPEICD